MLVILGRVCNLYEGYRLLVDAQHQARTYLKNLQAFTRYIERACTSARQKSRKRRKKRLATLLFIALLLSCVGCSTLTLSLRASGPLVAYLLVEAGLFASLAGLGLSLLWLTKIASSNEAYLSPKIELSIPQTTWTWLRKCEEKIHPYAPLAMIRGGWKGEQRLISFLTASLRRSDEIVLGLASLQMVRRSDIDLLLISERGIWVLESKYWRGHIQREADGRWLQYNGMSIKSHHPPDRQVLASRRHIMRFLEQRFPGHSWEQWVFGSVVFTHPHCSFQAKASPPVFCGGPEQFFSFFLQHPRIPALTMDLRLRIAEALLVHEAGPAAQDETYWRNDAAELARQEIRRIWNALAVYHRNLTSLYSKCRDAPTSHRTNAGATPESKRPMMAKMP